MSVVKSREQISVIVLKANIKDSSTVLFELRDFSPSFIIFVVFVNVVAIAAVS